MGSIEPEGNGPEALPWPPPVPENVVPIKADAELLAEPIKKPILVPMARKGLGTKGQRLNLRTNHFKFKVANIDGHFFHYCVSLFYEDGCPVDAKGVGRKVIDKVHETYCSDLANEEFAYDGEKTLFTVGPLPLNKYQFVVVLEDVAKER